MAKNNSLTDFLADIANAIRAKKGTSDPINAQDFASEIEGISGDNGGGELEGEYFLAKPNGRYWKFKFASWERPNTPVIWYDELTQEQKDAACMYVNIMGQCSCSAIGYGGGMPTSGVDNYMPTPIDVVSNIFYAMFEIENTGTSDYLPVFFQEGSIKRHDVGQFELHINGLPDVMRLVFEEELNGMSDDELIAMASEKCMMEQITKEEYDTYRYWNIN